MSHTSWSRESWDSSVSSRAYNSDWWDLLTPEKEPELWAELRSIFDEEKALGDVPGWASEIIVRMMELPMCGYWAYPANVTQILEAIANKGCPDVVLGCYTTSPERKTLLSYYVFCLDGWLKNAPLTNVITELSLRDHLGKNWEKIASGIYDTLRERTELKSIVVERLIHRLRWWIKSLIWPGDKRDRFLLDVYSGDIRGHEEKYSAYGNSPYGDPFFAEFDLPRVKESEVRILSDVPNGKRLLERIHSTWLCAPKVFRYVEKLIFEIGAIGSLVPETNAASILQCEDTYPDFDANREHFTGLVEDLRSWLDGDKERVPSLSEPSPIQRWLVHLLWHKLTFHAKYEENFGKLVGSRPHGKTGRKRPESS